MAAMLDGRTVTLSWLYSMGIISMCYKDVSLLLSVLYVRHYFVCTIYDKTHTTNPSIHFVSAGYYFSDR